MRQLFAVQSWKRLFLSPAKSEKRRAIHRPILFVVQGWLVRLLWDDRKSEWKRLKNGQIFVAKKHSLNSEFGLIFLFVIFRCWKTRRPSENAAGYRKILSEKILRFCEVFFFVAKMNEESLEENNMDDTRSVQIIIFLP